MSGTSAAAVGVAVPAGVTVDSLFSVVTGVGVAVGVILLAVSFGLEKKISAIAIAAIINTSKNFIVSSDVFFFFLVFFPEELLFPDLFDTKDRIFHPLG